MQPLILAHAALSSIFIARGDLQSAEKQLSEVSASVSPEVQGTVELARAELLFAKDQFQPAADAAQRSASDFNNAHEDEKSALALVTEARALEMTGRNSNALALCQEAERRAARVPSPVPALRARLVAWSLSGETDSNVPSDLHAKVVTLKNPELSLEEEFDRAMRAKRVGAQGAKELFQKLAGRATSSGYLTLSRRAASMAPSPITAKP